MRNRVLRGGYFLSTALIALSISGAFQPAKAQAVTTVVTVPGKIINSDGIRIFYTPTATPNSASLLDIATNTTTTVCNSCTVTSGYVTPTGAIFKSDKVVQLYNGALKTLTNDGYTIGAAGTYAFYEELSTRKTYVLNTTTGNITTSLIRKLELIQGGLTPQGTFAAADFPGMAENSNIYFFDGTQYTAITHQPYSTGPSDFVANGYFYARTDGTSILYLNWYPGMGGPAYDLIYDNPSTGEVSTLAVFPGCFCSSPIPTDYQISNGWVAYKDNSGNLFLISPSGTSTGLGAIKTLVALGSDGSVAYLNGGVLYLRDASGSTSNLGSSYTSAFQVGKQWYFYGDGQLATIGDLRVKLDASFNALAVPFNAADGAVLLGVSDFSTPRDIALAGSTTLYSGSFSILFSGVVSGPGSLTKMDPGTLILTGSNTYTGGTTITGGTLQIGNGGTTGSIAGDIVDNASLRFNRSDTYTYSGTISGTGAVTQAGSGTLVLNGHNSHTGGTTVSAGSLMVGDAAHPGALVSGDVTVAAGATLLGHGTIGGSVANSGTLAPGGSIGTLTVGSYTQASGGKLEIEVSPTDASRLHVTGAASLAGTVAFDFDAGTYGTRSYTVLDSSGLSGTFATVTMSGAPTNEFYQLQYTPTAVNLVLEPKRNAQIFSDFHRNTFATAETLNDMAFAHVETQHCTEHNAPQGRDREPACPKIAAWAQPFGGAGGYQDDNGLDNYSTRWAGVMGGIDFHSELGFALSITTAYASNTLAISGGSARATTNTFYLSLDGGMPLFDGRLDVNGHWIQNNSTATRTVNPDAGGSLTAKSSPKSEMFGGAVQYGHAIISEDLTASARLTYTGSNLSAFHESGAEPFALAIRSKTISSLYGDLRLRYGHVYETESGVVLVPDVSGGVRAVLGDTARNVDGSLFGTVYNVAAVPGGTQDRFAFVASAGVKARQSGSFSIYTRADTRISAHAQEGEITAGVMFDF